MTNAGRFGIAAGAGATVMALLGVAVAMAYHPVRPRVLCAMPLGNGDVAVYFGYSNELAEPVTEPFGTSNYALPATQAGKPPTEFMPGSSGSYPDAAFVVTAPAGEEVAWTLGPRTVRLDEDTTRCPIPKLEPMPEDVALVMPKPPPPPEIKVEPPPPPPEAKVEPPVEPPPPPPVQKARVKQARDVAKELEKVPVTLQIATLSNVNSGGMAVLSGLEDTLGEPGGVEGGQVGPAAVSVGGVPGGVGPVDRVVVQPPKRVAAKVLNRPKGEWPADAPPRAGSVVVRLSLLVGVDGHVKQVKVVRGAGPAFDREARAVGLRATFKPATEGDQPVESWVPWDVEFSPDD